MKKILCLVSIVSLAACGGTATSSRVASTTTINASTATVDCTGYQSDMYVPYGISTSTGAALAGQKFAKIVAVDAQDGKMKISILPPDGQTNFKTSLISELESNGYTIRIIACKENASSVVSGFSTTGVCNSKGPINLVGDTTVTNTEFLSSGFTFNATNVHATNIPSSSTYTKPDFIMITAGLTTSEVGDFIIAFGVSPYYNGCYNK